MRAVLIYPPLADAAQPYPALPALAAYLRMQGRHEPVQLDANIGYVQSVLTREGMAAAAGAVAARLEQFHRRPEGFAGAKEEYVELAGAALKAPFVVDGIDAAVRELRSWDTYRDLGRLDRAQRLLQEALSLLSAASRPPNDSFSGPHPNAFAAPQRLAAWAADEERNPFRAYFAACVLPALERLAPGAVGISVSFRSQPLGAATLAMMIRRALPGVPIILGGNMVGVWQGRWQELVPLFDWCDYLVPFEGETALDALLTALESGGPLDAVPNLIYREGGEIRRTNPAVEDLDSLPTPDYAGLPLDLYLAPETVFSLYTSRGCYWGRCAFCAVSPAMRLGHRRRSAARILDDVRTVGERHGARYVMFADDCVSPAALDQVVDAVRASGRKIAWQAEVRFESSLTGALLAKLRSAGCVNLVFGLESASSRVRDLMDKRTADEDIERILGECRRLGIACNLQLFFGFPGEGPGDAEETISFVLSQAHGAVTFSFGTFELQTGSRAERTPEAYGIFGVRRDAGPLAYRYEYEPVPAHAAPAREKLRRLLSERMAYLHAGLSMNAQTLFVLEACGPEALAALYTPGTMPQSESPAEIRDLKTVRLARSPALRTGTFLSLDPPGPALKGQEAQQDWQILAYDYDRDRAAAVSPAAFWLLEQLDGSQTFDEFLATLPGDLGDAADTLSDIARELYRRKLLRDVVV